MTAEHGTAKHATKRLWLAATIAAVIVGIIAYFALTYKSVDEQLAEIEAARAIPDSENAAIIYYKLLQDPNATSLLDYRPQFLDQDSDILTSKEPWLSKNYPELAAWIKEQQPVIDRLLKASKFDKCRFPIAVDWLQTDRLIAMRKWVFLLRRAANNDIAEGRADDTIAKYRCVTQLARHLYQQPILVEHLVGVAIEAIGLQGLYRLLIETDLTETQIKAIEQFQPTTRDNWADVSAEILEVERLLSKKTYHPLARLHAWWSGMSVQSSLKQTHDMYLRTVSCRRSLKIIIELRRYKNRHGCWPQTLDKIKSALPGEALIDSINDGSFVYRLANDTFTLYR